MPKIAHISVALGLIGILLTASCTFVDKRTAERKVSEVQTLVKVGDNIREAHALLSEEGFKPTPVVHGSISKTSYIFSVRITEHTKLDGLGYAMDVNLNPWRNSIPYHVVFRSGIDEKITRIEPK